MKKVLVSACLLGENCKYNGKNNKCEKVIALREKGVEFVAICPECFGGLKIPREPSEIKNGRVYSKSGEDVTEKFVSGAEKSLYIAEECFCDTAILKARSPSCGFGEIYDGSFSSSLVRGNGITAQLLYENGIRIYTEETADELYDEL